MIAKEFVSLSDLILEIGRLMCYSLTVSFADIFAGRNIGRDALSEDLSAGKMFRASSARLLGSGAGSNCRRAGDYQRVWFVDSRLESPFPSNYLPTTLQQHESRRVSNNAVKNRTTELLTNSALIDFAIYTSKPFLIVALSKIKKYCTITFSQNSSFLF